MTYREHNNYLAKGVSANDTRVSLLKACFVGCIYAPSGEPQGKRRLSQMQAVVLRVNSSLSSVIVKLYGKPRLLQTHSVVHKCTLQNLGRG
jgi:hypothetical protein